MYELLGVHPDVIRSYKVIHDLHRLKGQFLSGYVKPQRSSGEPTTALGNLITDLQVHTDLVLANYDKIVFMLFLGDDSVIAFSKMLNVKGYV